MSQPPSPSPSVDASSTAQSHRGIRGYACVPCAKRKVRCNRAEPCSNCQRRPNDHCHYLAPHPRRRHPKPSDTSAALARLQHLEQIVRELGVDVKQSPGGAPLRESQPHASPPTATAPSSHGASLRATVTAPPYPDRAPAPAVKAGSYPAHPLDSRQGSLVGGAGHRGHSRYLEDPIWNRLSDEVKNEADMLREASDDEDEGNASSQSYLPADSASASAWKPSGPNSLFLLQASKRAPSINHLHPAPHQIMALWRKFLDNVHPLVRIVTPKQKEEVIMRALNAMDSIRLRTSLFLFSMYFITVLSMTDDDCRQLLDESRAVLLDKYQYATEHALAASHILRTSDLVALQSLTLYLLAMRQRTDMNTLWALAGLLVRLGQRLGLHRDGATLNLSPWEVELRRRLWWHMQHIDTRAAQLSGALTSAINDDWDTQLPFNINDEDLHPDLATSPRDRTGATDMMHVLCRFELIDFVRSFRQPNGRRYGWSWVYSDVPLADKDRAIDALEEHMQHKYLKYCDALKPIHFMTTITIRAALNSIRLNAHHPRLQGGALTDLPPAEQDYLFELSMRSLQYDSMAHQQKLIEGFRWHTEAYFQWAALILLLIQLRTRTAGPAVDRAWDLLRDVYTVHPTFITDAGKSLHAATQALVVRAWAAREAYWKMQPQFLASVHPPPFVQAIRAQHLANKERSRRAGRGRPWAASGAGEAAEGYAGGGQQVASLPPAPLAPLQQYQPQQQQQMSPPLQHTGSIDDSISGDSLSFSPMDWAQWESLISEDMQAGWGTDMMDFGTGDVAWDTW